jgi:hypothetical protein
MKPRLIFLTLVISFGSTITAFASTPQVLLSQQDVIHGLGEHFPIAKDVSKSQNFHVYVFHKDGVSYVQINQLDGSVLTAIALAGSASFALPVGKLAASRVTVTNGPAAAYAATTATATCPCSSETVYNGPEGTIIVVYGSDGTVIQVIVFTRQSKAAS